MNNSLSSWREALLIIAMASGFVLALLLCFLPIYCALRTGSELADNLYLGSMLTTFLSFIIFGCVAHEL